MLSDLVRLDSGWPRRHVRAAIKVDSHQPSGLQPSMLSHKYPPREMKSSECPLKSACSFCTREHTQRATQETHTTLVSVQPLPSHFPPAPLPLLLQGLRHDFSPPPNRTVSNLCLLGLQTLIVRIKNTLNLQFKQYTN